MSIFCKLESISTISVFPERFRIDIRQPPERALSLSLPVNLNFGLLGTSIPLIKLLPKSLETIHDQPSSRLRRLPDGL